MKKLFAFAITLGSFSAVFAQADRTYNAPFKNDKDKNYHYEAPKQNDRRDDKRNTTMYDRNDRFDQRNQPRMSDRERQQQIDRINQDYDRRIASYRNDRRMNDRDRNYNIQVVEKERNSKLKSFGGGLLLGGLLGVILSR